MIAVVKTGGKQYKISEGDVIQVEKLDGKVGETINLDKVLICGEGNSIKVGSPYLEGCSIVCEVLREVGLSGQKVKYMKDLSTKFIDGIVRPRRMAYQDNEEIIQQLISIYGVGRWTAEMFLIFSLNRLDVSYGPIAET